MAIIVEVEILFGPISTNLSSNKFLTELSQSKTPGIFKDKVGDYLNELAEKGKIYQ